jgi:hypothetical protein
VISREELQQSLWPADTFVEFDHGLNNAVNRLRDVLGDDAQSPRFIETLPRRGYRFIASIIKDLEPASAPPLAEVEPQQTPRFAPRHMAVFAVTLAIVAALVVVVLRPGWLSLSRGAGDPPVHALAVLPFLNLSGDPAQDYFADGMTEALIVELSTLGGVRVISRTSSMQYKAVNKPGRRHRRRARRRRRCRGLGLAGRQPDAGHGAVSRRAQRHQPLDAIVRAGDRYDSRVST